MIDKRKKIGDYGENIAVGYLKEMGYEILETKYKKGSSEIDIIARDGGYTVFIEVKHRQNLEFGYPSESVGRSKQKSIIRAANHYIYENRLEDCDFRFDVFEIFGRETIDVNHIINAFITG